MAEIISEVVAEVVELTVNSKVVRVSAGTTVAAAIMAAGEACRRSRSGELRGPLCGMGVCFECRAVVNGTAHVRTCQMLCQPRMQVRTDG